MARGDWTSPAAYEELGSLDAPGFAWEYLERVHGTIGGGTNEIKRTLIAQAGLGLPRPPRVA